jgi:hypothetical protein
MLEDVVEDIRLVMRAAASRVSSRPLPGLSPASAKSATAPGQKTVSGQLRTYQADGHRLRIIGTHSKPIERAHLQSSSLKPNESSLDGGVPTSRHEKLAVKAGTNVASWHASASQTSQLFRSILTLSGMAVDE